ncbi:unnamed protein product [Brassica oleracea]
MISGQANLFSGVHCYNKATGFGGTGIYLKLPGLTQNRIVDSYLDYTGIVAENPVQLKVSGTFFLGDTSKAFENVDQVVIYRNSVNGMAIRSTVAKGSVDGNGTSWIVDFNPVLLFPNLIIHVQCTLVAREGGGFLVHAVSR